MSEFAVRVEHLGKRYRLGEREPYRALRDVIAGAAAAPFRRQRVRRSGGSVGEEWLWALRDVSFDVQQGEAVGIIGRNGAGKSTLLKILSRITEPEDGYAEIRGRVASLLEVGTGFHPELTGRENVFLNGAILGMKTPEIRRKFDEIVAFAEVERFIDTPVKRYSSGMYVRLAFAVAAHLEPEILIIDEVLAVGDLAFQRKCLGKMNDVAKQGRTVLFVSHNVAAVQSLCTSGILLHDGRVMATGSASETVATYLGTLEHTATQSLADRRDRQGKGLVRLVQVDISSEDRGAAKLLATGRPARFNFHLSATRPGTKLSFTIYDQYGQPVSHLSSGTPGHEDTLEPDQDPVLQCEFDELLLLPGHYRINVAIETDRELQDHVEAAALFNVEEGNVRGRPVVGGSASYGSVHLPHRWTRGD